MTAVLSANLYKAVKEASKQADKPNKNLPVTFTVKLLTHDGHLVVTPFAWEKRNEKAAAAPARVVNEFETCVPMKAFRDWLSVTAKYKTVLELTFDAKTQILTVTEIPAPGNPEPLAPSRARFKCIDAGEFPPV